MISSISVKAFKSFPEKKLKFGKLNIFTGLNNSGKSTILQALRMCDPIKGPFLEGLGDITDIRSRYSHHEANVEISLEIDEKEIVRIALGHSNHKYRSSDIPFPIMEYVSADRYGPRVSLPVMRKDVSTLSVGERGEFSAHYASMCGSISINTNLRHENTSSTVLHQQLVKWMGEVSPGVDIDFDVARRYESSSISVDKFRSTNSGFGLSYSLPIVLCLLALTGSVGKDNSSAELTQWFAQLKKRGAVLLIENPEAHLHPLGQTNMGRLISLAASAGLQIFIETHSDHLLDGIRLGVKNSKGDLKGDDVKIMYFTKNSELGSQVQDIILRDDGKINYWPEGFFDQYALNLRELSKIDASR